MVSGEQGVVERPRRLASATSSALHGDSPGVGGLQVQRNLENAEICSSETAPSPQRRHERPTAPASPTARDGRDDEQSPVGSTGPRIARAKAAGDLHRYADHTVPPKTIAMPARTSSVAEPRQTLGSGDRGKSRQRTTVWHAPAPAHRRNAQLMPPTSTFRAAQRRHASF